MSAAKHTEEPWVNVVFELANRRVISQLKGGPDSRAALLVEHDGSEEGRANVERVVACVNACAGLAEPAVVPDLVAALRETLEELEALRDVLPAPRPTAESAVCHRARAAIARAEGGAR